MELRETWAGDILLEQLHLAEMREAIRAHAAQTGTPYSAIASELKMSPRRLRDFLAGTELTNDDWAPVALWCEDKPTPQIVPETVALGVLARWAPRKHVRDVRAAIANVTRAEYARIGRQLPSWTAEALVEFDIRHS
ncbi:MAG TPA: hypothetical protein VFJ82_06525 [Longimicrobium sp.]|nr:hypothetical protein [Longimicrobium sp.]